MDAIVGNPPYIRQEKINEYYGKNYKTQLQEIARTDAPGAALSGRSDVLCYFFTHGFALLEDDGYIGLLTSSNWLDTSYGFDLQKFLLENFEIIAVFESNCEPWFTGARVTTAATILRKQSSAEKRDRNNVKFVWLKQPIADFVQYSKGDETARRATFEDIRQKIENLTAEEENQTWRVRVVNQAELFKAGCLSFDVQDEVDFATEDTESTENSAKEKTVSAVKAVQTNFLGNAEQPSLQMASDNPKSKIQNLKSNYKGYKWGIYLPAPEIFSKLLKRGGAAFVPLGQIADVKRGVTSGCDAFFFPRDVTAEKLAENLSDKDFKDRYGITKKETEKIRIVHAGDKSQHLIEAEYLEPVVFNLMEIDSIEINSQTLNKQILLINEEKDELKGKRVLKYIKFGEHHGFNERPTCASRNLWYSLDTHQRGNFFWTKSQRYRHIVPINEQNYITNCNLYDISTKELKHATVLGAILNSTIMVLIKHQFGRTMGGDPLLKTEVSDVKMMLVPDARLVSPEIKSKLINALDSMRKRKTKHLVDVDSTDEENWTGELALADRQQLDDAVLELVGIADAAEIKNLRDELYREITKLYRQIRVAEKKMQKFRSATASKGKQTAHGIAEEIWTELAPLDFVLEGAKTETIDLPVGKAKIAAKSLYQNDGVSIGDYFIELGSVERSVFVKTLADLSLHGAIKIPLAPEICAAAMQKNAQEFERVNELFYTEAATFVADENVQEKIVKELWKKLRNN